MKFELYLLLAVASIGVSYGCGIPLDKKILGDRNYKPETINIDYQYLLAEEACVRAASVNRKTFLKISPNFTNDEDMRICYNHCLQENSNLHDGQYFGKFQEVAKCLFEKTGHYYTIEKLRKYYIERHL